MTPRGRATQQDHETPGRTTNLADCHSDSAPRFLKLELLKKNIRR